MDTKISRAPTNPMKNDIPTKKKKLAPERYRTQISIEKITSQMKVITICVDSTAGNAEIASVGV